MIVNIRIEGNNAIEPGDAVLSKKGAYFVVQTTYNEFGISLINLETGIEENAFRNLDALNNNYYVTEEEPIVRVVKGRDLILKEAETHSFVPEITEDNVAVAEEVKRKMNKFVEAQTVHSKPYSDPEIEDECYQPPTKKARRKY